ncbi:MAG: Ig-like domain-containing protein [Muribaculaceae bacterium]|nr:Ig-like domain-containing protein [Muribaculaceae bacterium]
MELAKTRYLVLAAIMGLVLWSCASIGSPEGGPIDYTPPRVVKTSPEQGALRVNKNKVEITFDEFIALKDQQKKVVISPVQREMPVVRSQGKKVTVEFRDTLLPNTTYCIDFSDAIEDFNEGNPLEGYSFAFSTGDSIDSLAVSGIVLRARDLEPMQSVVVGLHSNLDDSALTRLPLERIGRTNDRGQFTIRNLRPGRYHIFALSDVDGDYRMARTEDMAFLDEVIVPSVSQYTSVDTIFSFDRKVDSVYTATHTDFLPNNLLLNMFNENYKPQYLKTTSRLANNKLHILMGAPADTLPTLRILAPLQHQPDWYRLERREQNDSLVYWITDSALIKSDSIVVELTYLRTDSTDHLTAKTDTVIFAQRKTGAQLKQENQERKEREQLAKRMKQLQEKREKALAKGKDLDEGELEELREGSKPQEPRLKMEVAKSGDLDVGDSIGLKFEVPIAHIDPAGVHLELKRDSLWVPMPNVPPMELASELSPLRYNLPLTLMPDSTYRLTVDTLAVTSVYGITSDPLVKEFKVRGLEEYANLYFTVNVRDTAFAELLDGTERVTHKVLVKNGAFEILNILPGNYYVRLTIDRNANGVWDTGNYSRHEQPEEVYYYPKRLNLRKNWDVDETWNIYETPVDLQKPEAIKKNRPTGSRNKLQKRDTRDNNGEEEEEDEFNSKGFGTNAYSGNKYQDYQNKRRARR